MTDDNWKTSRMAIGLGYYDKSLVYGVWADLLVGNMIVGNDLIIKNDDGSVEITGDGITIKKGVISWDNVNSPEIDNIKGLAQSITASEDNAKKYADEQDNNLETSLTDAYKSYANSEISKFDSVVAKYLKSPTATTLIGENYVISPLIEGGYMNITSGSNQVIIDPQKLSNTDYIFAVKHGNEFTVGITPDGTASFKGDIKATSLTLLNDCKLPYSNISGAPKIPSDIKDLTDTNKTLKNIVYKNQITSTTKEDDYGVMYTEYTVPGSTGTITYKSYETDDYMLFGRPVGNGTLGGTDAYTCISKNGLLQANNAIIYGTIYATDGKFNGSIYSKSGRIGGWEIAPGYIRKETTDDSQKHHYMLTLSSENYSITSEAIYDTHDPRVGIQYDTTEISKGIIVCSRENKSNVSEPQTASYESKITASGISYEDKLSGTPYFQLDCDRLEVDVPSDFNNGLSEYGQALCNRYCVVQTGTNSTIGTGKWVHYTVDFEKAYEQEPFINVMPTSNFPNENITFDDFKKNSGSYTGFKYSVYCKETIYTYATKWFAVGNIK